MRQGDPEDLDIVSLRKGMLLPETRVVLEVGNVMIPESNIALSAVVASSVFVTLYDSETKRGGAGMFLRAVPPEGQAATPLFGLPLCAALLRSFMSSGSKTETLTAGIFGGAWPEWANSAQREISRANVEVVRDVMRRKGIPIADEDTGGHRGRKLVYVTGTNEIAILRTERVRRTDWFPGSGDEGGI